VVVLPRAGDNITICATGVTSMSSVDVRIPDPPASRRGWALVALCFVVAPSIGRRFRYDGALQDFFTRPWGTALAIVLVGVYLAVLLRWSGRDRERLALLAGVAAGTGLVFLELTLIHVHGWFGGTMVRPPLATQLMVYGPHIFAVGLGPLALYRWMARRWSVAALAVYFAWVVFFSWATAPVENDFIARGVLAFRNGFHMREDILWGGLFYLLALSVYLGLARDAGARPAASDTTHGS
jgi:hypothetical protein